MSEWRAEQRYIYIYKERERERDWEKNESVGKYKYKMIGGKKKTLVLTAWKIYLYQVDSALQFRIRILSS